MTEQLKKWNLLPNEILQHIVNFCGKDCKHTKWMFTNKKWFDFYLSQAFTSITIDLTFNDKKVDKILFSSFDVGKRVQHITFDEFTHPEDIESLDMFNDCLVMLMKETPNVKGIEFLHLEKLSLQEWSYLSTVFANTDYWKLNTLPNFKNVRLLYSPYYFLCALSSRHSLTHLNLSFGMTNGLDFFKLKEFTALQYLKVGKRVINNVCDIDLLLNSLPRLKELSVTFSDNRAEFLYDDDQYDKPQLYPNLKKLILINFTPKQNDEMFMIIDKLNSVDNLKIISERGARWPENEVGLPVSEIFFNAIHSISTYEITVCGIFRGKDLAKKWINSMEGSQQQVHLSLSFLNQDELSIGSNVSVTIKSSLSNYVSILEYKLLNDSNISEGVKILNDLNERVSVVEIIGVYLNIESILRALILKEHANLDTLIIKESDFNEYPLTNNVLRPIQSIKNLIFRNCIINLNALKLFSSEFEVLDYVNFDCCYFLGNPRVEPISMPNTLVRTIHITCYHDSAIKIIIASLHLTAKNHTRYYLAVEDNLVQTTTKAPFDLLRSKLNDNEVMVVNFVVKSTKKIAIKLTDKSKQVEIMFPEWQ